VGAILLFALLMQWLKPADMVIRVVNQMVKLAAIWVGVWMFVGRGGEKALVHGALLGLVYMGIGVGLYALLSGQQLPISAYAADLAMGVAGGGITGGVLGNLRKR
jgi:putative membrane protein (TIGR04086 family)